MYHFKRLALYFFEQRADVNSSQISAVWYRILWICALTGAIPSFLTLTQGNLLGIDNILSACLGIAILFHWFMVYQDIHQLEESTESLRNEYWCWVDSRAERMIRGIIVFFLLFGVGKIADGFLPLAQYIQRPEIKNFVLEFLHPDIKKNLGASLFIRASVALYFFLAAWNVFALSLRLKNAKSYPAGNRSHFHFTTIRIVCFCVLSVVCFFYWLLLSIGSLPSNPSLTFLAGMYIILISIVFMFRSGWIEKIFIS